jgi:hypothetical protein
MSVPCVQRARNDFLQREPKTAAAVAGKASAPITETTNAP